jgi:hypothetical protein
MVRHLLSRIVSAAKEVPRLGPARGLDLETRRNRLVGCHFFTHDRRGETPEKTSAETGVWASSNGQPELFTYPQEGREERPRVRARNVGVQSPESSLL